METLMEIDKKWKDISGNIKPNSRDKDSENPSVFNNITGMMLHLTGSHDTKRFDLGQLNANKRLTNGGEYITNDYDIEKVLKWENESSLIVMAANALKLSHILKLERSPNRFSLDEINGVTSGSAYMIRNAPEREYALHNENLWALRHNTKQSWYRPYDIGASLKYARNPAGHHRLKWQLEKLSKSAFECKDKDARGNYHASGKVQAWIRCVGLGLDLENVSKYMPENNGLVTMFQNFFPEVDHPINIMARRLYDEQRRV